MVVVHADVLEGGNEFDHVLVGNDLIMGHFLQSDHHQKMKN